MKWIGRLLRGWMGVREPKFDPSSYTSLIDHCLAIDGPINIIGGTLHVHGHVTGKISGVQRKASGSEYIPKSGIVLFSDAVIKGDVDVDFIHVHGDISGDVIARETVVVFPTGRIFGSVMAKKIRLEEGSTIVGTLAPLEGNRSGE